MVMSVETAFNLKLHFPLLLKTLRTALRSAQTSTFENILPIPILVD